MINVKARSENFSVSSNTAAVLLLIACQSENYCYQRFCVRQRCHVVGIYKYKYSIAVCQQLKLIDSEACWYEHVILTVHIFVFRPSHAQSTVYSTLTAYAFYPLLSMQVSDTMRKENKNWNDNFNPLFTRKQKIIILRTRTE
jgi:hypothetical protein